MIRILLCLTLKQGRGVYLRTAYSRLWLSGTGITPSLSRTQCISTIYTHTARSIIVEEVKIQAGGKGHGKSTRSELGDCPLRAPKQIPSVVNHSLLANQNRSLRQPRLWTLHPHSAVLYMHFMQ